MSVGLTERYGPDQSREQKITRLKDLCERVLPALARERRWPIRLDHCFKRVCFDHAFGDVWYRHTARPAERSLSGPALDRALCCAEELAAGSDDLLRQRNQESLRWRGKLVAGA